MNNTLHSRLWLTLALLAITPAPLSAQTTSGMQVNPSPDISTTTVKTKPVTKTVTKQATKPNTAKLGRSASSTSTTTARPKPVIKSVTKPNAANSASTKATTSALAATVAATAKTKTALTQDESIVTVTVHAIANVAKDTFTLGEIADIVGKDRELAAQLAAVPVGASPLPGLARGLMPGDVTVHLRAAHLESKRVQVLLPPGIRITRTGTDVPTDSVVKAALAAAQEAIKSIPNATLEPLNSETKFIVPTGKVEFVAGAWKGQVESGTIFIPVSILVDGKTFQTPEIGIRIHRKQTVVVARRNLDVHTVLNPEDVTLATIDLLPGFAQPFSSTGEVIGKRLTHRLLADSPLSGAMLDLPPAVTMNDKVTIEYLNGPIRITAPGVARQTGMIGDHIRVFALDTHKELEGVVVDSQTIRIVEQ